MSPVSFSLVRRKDELQGGVVVEGARRGWEAHGKGRTRQRNFLRLAGGRGARVRDGDSGGSPVPLHLLEEHEKC